ncbi:MAG: diadenylate cyclase [Opitutae bacterium]|nr:diadenylate cyclase [Opitutae bacterium]MCD8298635.1 diadenylate cyclase [Opitutae bacterium]
MRRFLSQNRIVDLTSRDFSSALAELLKIAMPAETSEETLKSLHETLLKRKEIMPRGGGIISVPHVRADIEPSVIFAIGRIPRDTAPAAAEIAENSDKKNDSADAQNATLAEKDGDDSAAPANTSAATPTAISNEPSIIFLVLASQKSRIYHSVLAEIVQDLGDKNFLKNLFEAKSLKEFRSLLTKRFKGVTLQAGNIESGMNLRVGTAAQRLAIGTKCSVLLFFADTFSKPTMLDRFVLPEFRIVIVSSENYSSRSEVGERPEVIVVRSFSNHRLSQLRAAIFIALMRGLVKPTDRVCCLGGQAKSDKLDSILILDAAQEFPSVMVTRANSIVPAKVRPEVLERVIALATELAVEGREGKPIGTMLIVGDRDKIRPFVEPLIMNPFNGYSPEDRNILNPFMAETVKELALIDGAFVVDGNGVIDSAGSNVVVSRTGEVHVTLPGGLGTRHAAGCAISKVADCAAIVVSSSGQITLFRHGEAIILMERSQTRAI